MRLRSAGWLFSVQVASVLVGFPLSVIIARALGPEGKGTLALIQLLAETGALVLGLGLPNAYAYFAARKELGSAAAIRSSLLIGAAAFVVSLSVFVASPVAARQAILRVGDAQLLTLASVGVALTLSATLLSNFVVGSGDARRASLIVTVALFFQLLIDGILFVFRALTVVTAALVRLASGLLNVIGLGLIAGSCRSRTGPLVLDLTKRMLSFGTVSWFTNLAQYLALRQDLYLIALFLGPQDVGVYTIAVTFAQLATFAPTALSGVLMPKVAGEGSDSGGADLTARLARTAWPVVVGMAALVAVVAVPVIPLLFGERFAGAAVPLLVLVPAMGPFSVNATLSAFLIGSGSPASATAAWVTNVVVNVAANIVLLPRLGLGGAALASLVSYSTGSGLMLFAFMQKTGIPLRRVLVPCLADFRAMLLAARSVIGYPTIQC